MANDQIVQKSSAAGQGLAPFTRGEHVTVADARFAALYPRVSGRSDAEYATELAARGLCVLATRAEVVTGQLVRLWNEATDRGIPLLVLSRDAIDDARDAGKLPLGGRTFMDPAAALKKARGK